MFSPETRPLSLCLKARKNHFPKMDLIPTHFWLTSVRYLEGKRAIFLEFSGPNSRRMARFAFFPSFFVSKGRQGISDGNCVRDALSNCGQRFRVEDCGNAFRVRASNFAGLNLLADALFNETGFRPLVLVPERQFLLEKNWSFFDCFTVSEEGFFPAGLPSVPAAKLGFFSEPLPETVRLAAEEDSGLAEKILESLALSSILRLPVESLVESDFWLGERLLENIFWATGIGAGQKSLCVGGKGNADSEKQLLLKGNSEVDFSLLWPTLMSKPFYNLSPDSIDCACCRPKGVLDKNVLPSTVVLVEMLRDGFFFESCSGHFSDLFHDSMPEKESRLRRMGEFCLKEKPIGPFFRGQHASILLADALALESGGEARVLGLEKPHWFCLEKEGSVPMAISSINSAISGLENSNEQCSSMALRQHGMLARLRLSTDPDFLFRQAILNANSRLLCLIPGQLCNLESSFFSQRLCLAIESIQATVLEKFRAFAGKSESRVVATGQNKAIVSTSKPYSLIRRFSEKQSIPAILKAKSV
jgi:hypothetical protein